MIWTNSRRKLALWASAVLILSTLAAVAALLFPPLTGRIIDDAHILSAQTIADLNPKLATLEDRSGIQLVVATTPSLQGADIETFASELFRSWKLGDSKKDNGILFLVAPNDRKVRIEVGYGLEGTMTDALSKVIIQSAVLPSFKTGDYSGGVVKGVDAIVGALTVDAAEWQMKTKVRADQQSEYDWIVPLVVLLLFVFVLSVMMKNARGQSGRWVRRGNRTIFIHGPIGGGWGGGSGGGFGGGSGGGFGGGFSGGGGSSGGGGASGDW